MKRILLTIILLVLGCGTITVSSETEVLNKFEFKLINFNFTFLPFK